MNLGGDCEIQIRERIGTIRNRIIMLPSHVLDFTTSFAGAAGGTPVYEVAAKANAKKLPKSPFPPLKPLQWIFAAKPLVQEVLRSVFRVLLAQALKTHPMSDGIAVNAAQPLKGSAGALGIIACGL
jgi:hypothetical protein